MIDFGIWHQIPPPDKESDKKIKRFLLISAIVATIVVVIKWAF